jgi:hypothetical protein
MHRSVTIGSRRLLAVLGLLVLLGACNSTDSTLGVEQPATNPEPANPATTVTPTTIPPTGSEVASLAPNTVLGNVYFAPVVGAPVTSVSALSARLSTAAAANGIKLEPSASVSINHEIRGYFSALSESGTITVIHVWDVFTPQGQRVHRIQGEEKIVGAASDPWAAVPAATMEKIADSVLRQYATWRGAS